MKERDSNRLERERGGSNRLERKTKRGWDSDRV
jgi:hypothetical protein